PSQAIEPQSAIQMTPPQPAAVDPAEDAPDQVPSGTAAADGESATAAPDAATDAAVETTPAGEAAAAPAADSVAASPAALAAAHASPATTASGSGPLSFRFGADSCVEVRVASGTIRHSVTNRAGSTRSVQGTAPFTLVVGNAANVTLEQDGKAVDLAAHVRGSVARLTLR